MSKFVDRTGVLLEPGSAAIVAAARAGCVSYPRGRVVWDVLRSLTPEIEYLGGPVPDAGPFIGIALAQAE
jgi:hypothetical protein